MVAPLWRDDSAVGVTVVEDAAAVGALVCEAAEVSVLPDSAGHSGA